MNLKSWGSFFKAMKPRKRKSRDLFDEHLNLWERFVIWRRLRRYKRHMRGIDMSEILVVDEDGVESLHRTGEQRALIMIHEIVENEQPIDLKPVIEAQLYEIARHDPKAKDAAMFVWELVKVLR